MSTISAHSHDIYRHVIVNFIFADLRLLRTSETSSAMEESPPMEQMEFMCGRGSLRFQIKLSRGKFFTGADFES